MDRLRQDVRFALRALRRSPGFAAVAILTVTLGIGINTAIFSVVDGVILRPLPYPEPDRLVTVWEDWEERGGPVTEWTGRSTFADWRDRARTFAGMSAVTEWSPQLTGVDRPEVLEAALVSPGYFAVMGVPPASGRAFAADEETPGRDDVVVLSDELWRGRFGGDAAILGRTLVLNGRPHTVVGVAPPGFRGPIASAARLWAPLPIDRAREDYGNYFLRVVGRLAPGTSLAAAREEMTRVAASVAREHPLDYRDVGVTLEPLHDTVTGPVRTSLLVLLGAVGLVLLIACANVANLLLARASVRERELAVRSALGAGRGRLARQLLTESVVLASVGGALGLALGVWGTAALVRLAPPGLPRAEEIGLHPTVLLFAVAASVVTGLLFGLAPALGVGRGTSQALREGGRGAVSASGGRLRGALVVFQLGLGMAVLASAGLLLRSLAELRSVDPGFRVEGILSGRLLFPSARYPEADRVPAVVASLEERIAALPGVRSVGAISVLPLSGLVHDVNFAIEGRMPEPGEEPAADERHVTPGFFEAMEVPLLRGRTFEARDRDGATRVAIVSESFVDRFSRDQDPIGRRIKIGGVRDPESPWWTIVGVVGSVRSRALDRVAEPEIYVPLAQGPARGISLVLGAENDPSSLAGPFREAVRSLDPDLPVSQLATLEELFAASLAPQRFLSTLLAIFATLALVLGGVGIYGVMAFTVSRRTREIGIRMALGARPGDILGSVMRGGAWLTAGGLTLGAAGSLAATRGLSGLLYEVSPTDPPTLVGVAVVLGAAALFACWWPARRATRVDPMVTLRSE